MDNEHGDIIIEETGQASFIIVIDGEDEDQDEE